MISGFFIQWHCLASGILCVPWLLLAGVSLGFVHFFADQSPEWSSCLDSREVHDCRRESQSGTWVCISFFGGSPSFLLRWQSAGVPVWLVLHEQCHQYICHSDGADCLILVGWNNNHTNHHPDRSHCAEPLPTERCNFPNTNFLLLLVSEWFMWTS